MMRRVDKRMDQVLTQLLGCRYPIVEGGLAYVGNGQLAGALSKAGAFGQIGCGGRSLDGIYREVEVAVASSGGRPFGINLPLSEHSDREPVVRLIEELSPFLRAVSLSAGNPRPYIDRLKQRGLLVMTLVSTPLQAIKAVDAGADIVVAEGYEAGGHNGPAELTTLTLIPQVAAAVSVPIVAAGGIATGGGIAAALALGAAGAQLGTRFVATVECEAHERYKERLVSAQAEDTCVIERSLGRVTRVLTSPWVEKILEIERDRPSFEVLRPLVAGERNRIAALMGDTDEGWLNGGQSVGLVQDIKTAEEIVARLVTETEAALRQMAGVWPIVSHDPHTSVS